MMDFRPIIEAKKFKLKQIAPEARALIDVMRGIKPEQKRLDGCFQGQIFDQPFKVVRGGFFMNLTTQKRLAADILKVGVNRVWIDPEGTEEVSRAITRESVKQLINNRVIVARPKKGISSYRSKKIAEQKKKGRRKGRGSIKGAKGTRNPKKKAWMTTIRALRKDLKDMRDNRDINKTTYRKLYKMAKGGAFRSKSYMKTYARDHDLLR